GTAGRVQQLGFLVLIDQLQVVAKAIAPAAGIAGPQLSGERTVFKPTLLVAEGFVRLAVVVQAHSFGTAAPTGWQRSQWNLQNHIAICGVNALDVRQGVRTRRV